MNKTELIGYQTYLRENKGLASQNAKSALKSFNGLGLFSGSYPPNP